jgi:lipoyl-dependent peroxiredoxin
MEAFVMAEAHFGQVHVVNGREGRATSATGTLDVALSRPGPDATGTNPEALFAAGYGACFSSAVQAVRRIAGLPAVKVEANVTVDLVKSEVGDYSLTVVLAIRLPGVETDEAIANVAAAHKMCPYSRAIEGNVAVTLSANGTPDSA